MITFKEAFAAIPGDGWLSEGEAELLFNEAAACEGPILEVGCFKGRSTCLLASLGRPVYAVDKFEGFSDSETWQSVLAKFRANTLKFDNVYLWRMDIADWTPRPVGFAYLDSDHTKESTELQIRKALECSPKVIAIRGVSNSAAVSMLGRWRVLKETMAVWSV